MLQILLLQYNQRLDDPHNCAYDTQNCFTYSEIETRIINYIFQKYERACRDIKTKKAQEQDWDGTLAIKLN